MKVEFSTIERAELGFIPCIIWPKLIVVSYISALVLLPLALITEGVLLNNTYVRKRDGHKYTHIEYRPRYGKKPE